MQRAMRTALLGATAAAVAAGAGVFTLDSAMAAEPAPDAAQALSIPAPTGEYAVGTTRLHLVDEDRADVWVPEEDRELMVSMYYPTADAGETAPYMTAEEGALFGAQLNLPGELLASVETNAVLGAEPLADDGALPLVILSPGFSFPRATLTGLAEELASRGYAVAAVGHTYEAPITFPDRTTECLTCTHEDLDTDTLVPNRAEDLSFVLDELTGDDASWEDAAGLAGLGIDEDRVAVGGHSIGGASAHRVLANDDRFDAGFNLDGTFFALDPHQVEDPFLMVGGGDDHGSPGQDKTWDCAWKKLDGWKRWVSVTGTTHSSMTDFGPLGQQAGLNQDDLDGFRSNEISRALITAFVDTHLRGEDEPILDGPNPNWPELEFHNP